MPNVSTKLRPYQVATATIIQTVRHEPGIPTFWLPLSHVMAFVEVESGFDDTRWGTSEWGSIPAADKATTGSEGLMQVSAIGLRDVLDDWAQLAPLTQTDPLASITAGMLELYLTHERLLKDFPGESPSQMTQLLVMTNNQGIGNTVAGRKDWGYWVRWISAQRGYAFLDG